MVFSLIVSTVKKSVARIPDACDRRKSVHVGPARRGAVAQEDRADRRRGDPDLELQQLPADPLVPPPWFSLPRRATRSRTSGSIGGRPG